MSIQTPSIGRVVHYQAYGTPGGEYKSVPRAAIITGLHADTDEIDVFVMNPSGVFFNRCKLYPADQPTPGHCNWPPFVPPAAK